MFHHTPFVIGAALAGMLLGLLPGWSEASDVRSELALIRERMARSFLPEDKNSVARETEMAKGYLSSMREDGSFPDVNYADTTRGAWKADAHVRRLVTMARAYRTPGSSLQGQAALKDAIHRGLRAWFSRDPQNPNWWNNQIGVPHMIGEILILMHPDTPADVLQQGAVILGRSDYVTYIGTREVAWNGANLVDMAKSRIMLGIMTDDVEMVELAFQKAYGEIRVAAPGEEGIQADFSFHQHGSLLYDGGYGEVFMQVIARLLALTEGTRFAPEPPRRALFDQYILDGPRWMVRNTHYDYGVIGRGISRVNRTNRGFANAVAVMAALSGPRRVEYGRLLSSLKDGAPPAVTGNRHFWRSDFMSHIRKDWMATARGHSTRTFNTDGTHNGEGVKSHHLSDGAMFLYRSGAEYHDIFPAWDWRKIPGTTVVQSVEPLDPTTVLRKGTTNFVGGVSDASCGLSVMDLQRNTLSARKAWFFFDEEALCLGAGITDTSGQGVATTINQCRLSGPIQSERAQELPDSLETNIEGRWVVHDGFGYLVPQGSNLRLKQGNASGRWSDIGVGSDRMVTAPLFALWIDHGRQPRDAQYQYRVIPNATVKRMKQQADSPTVEVLSNTPRVQAARHRKDGQMMAAFYEAGEVNDGEGGLLRVDRPCLVLLKETEEGKRLAVSHPGNVAMSVRITHLDKSGRMTSTFVELPDGSEAGKTVVRDIVQGGGDH